VQRLRSAIVANVASLSKRIIVGRAMRSDRLTETLLPKRIALPVFASDAMSSVAYATQEILLVLSLAGVAFLHLAWYAAAGVVIVLTTVVAAYRQNVHAYPSGGGDYEVAGTNLGRKFGLVVAAALMVDYVLTVAVSTSAGVENLASTPLFSWMAASPVATTLAVVVTIVMMNLRGLRESGIAFAIPTYAFMFGILSMILVGLFRLVSGADLKATSAAYGIRPELHNLGTAAVLFLGLRAFASGCTALTGVEAISNGVPAFRKPKSKNAANTLALMGIVAVTMFSGVTFLAIKLGVRVTETNSDLIGFTGKSQDTVIAQIGTAVFGGQNNLPFYYVQLVTALILVLAANTAFNGFPVLASILAQDRYMPRQMHNRGDRLVFSNGIVLLALFACVLIYAFDANSTKLIQLYIVGVFVSFTCSQAGMVRHWNRLLRGLAPDDRAGRRTLLRRRAISAFAFVTTGTVLLVVLVTKFAEGAWIAIVAMVLLWFLMQGIHRHYQSVTDELAVGADEPAILPSRVHSIVLVSKLHRPALQALAYARATRPSSLEAITVAVDPDEARALADEWERRRIPVPLKVLDSPFREITRPVVDYIQGIRTANPRDLVTVFVPEYVVGRWWEQLLHNQSALRLRTRLRFASGVVVTSVPYLLASGEAAKRTLRARARRNRGGAATLVNLVRTSEALDAAELQPPLGDDAAGGNGSAATSGSTGVQATGPGTRHPNP
jgi:amino acid transporter